MVLFGSFNAQAVGRRTLFEKDGDYQAFEKVMEETLRTRRMRLVAYCLMPNHWHFVVWPENDGDLAAFMQQMNTSIKSCATRSGTPSVPIRGQERSRGAGRVFGGTHVMTRHFACFPIAARRSHKTRN
jgi:REP element-mobilizing transposase RayT